MAGIENEERGSERARIMEASKTKIGSSYLIPTHEKTRLAVLCRSALPLWPWRPEASGYAGRSQGSSA
jgi:hypothetical protein